MTEAEQPPQNGIDLSANEDDDNSKARPADIEQDMREMERRKRVEAIMGSKLFREELERIVDSARDAGNSGSILQQLSDIVGLPASRVGSVYKASNCLIPINDIRGVESMGYAKGEKILRCKLASTFRLLDLYGWTQGLGAQITARLKVDQEYFLVNPYGLLYHEITASSLNKVDMQGHIVEQGTTNFGVNKSHFVLHSVVHAARPDIRCAIYIGCSPVVAVSSLKTGLLPITKDACVLGDIATHHYTGTLLVDAEERDRLVRSLGPNSKVLLLTNHGALCCGETIEEAFHAACHIVQACETQLKLLPVGLDNLSLIPDETRKVIYEQSRRPPEDLEKKFAETGLDTKEEIDGNAHDGNVTATKGIATSPPKWRVGGAEFEALMRMLDNAGYRTGYIYRHPLIKSDPPKPKNDVELPPAVSSLGYLLEEEEMIRQGYWKKGSLMKGGDRSKWLNSPNVYQKVEVLETGTPDPKKITKWVAEGSPTHSTPVRIDDALQFVPAGTNPKEFKRLQQQIKDNRRADKISAGPQSHILEGVTWDEANRMKDASVSLAGDHVVLMGAASKGIIQRGFQHNATVYKAPYAKNPFDNVTDDELNEYKRTVERKKKSIHGEYTDTDFSESEALSSLQAGAQKHIKTMTQSEPEDIAEHQVMRIETQQAPVPSQPEVVLSDDVKNVINESSKSYSNSQRQPQTSTEVDIEEYSLTNSYRLRRHANLTADLKRELVCKKFGRRSKGGINKRGRKSLPTGTTIQDSYNAIRINELNLTVPQTKFKKMRGLYMARMPKRFQSRAALNSKNLQNIDCCKLYDEPYAVANWKELNLPKYCYADEVQVPNGCFTPNVCKEIIESLNEPYASKNLILNIPFSPNTSVCSTARQARSVESGKRNAEAIAIYKASNPYRTVSHFGFMSPQRNPKPEHKHLPNVDSANRKDNCNLDTLKTDRVASYEEIFSSPRYLQLCESCFDTVLRCKSEVKLKRTHLCNLANMNNIPGRAVYANSDDYVAESTAENSAIYCSILDPVPEVELELEEVNSEITRQAHNHDVNQRHQFEKSLSNSSFIRKISEMNYSEESANYNFGQTPCNVSSDICLDSASDVLYHGIIDQMKSTQKLQDQQRNMPIGNFSVISPYDETMKNKSNNFAATDDINENTCITEIWDFGDWQNAPQQTQNSDAELNEDGSNLKSTFTLAATTTLMITHNGSDSEQLQQSMNAKTDLRTMCVDNSCKTEATGDGSGGLGGIGCNKLQSNCIDHGTDASNGAGGDSNGLHQEDNQVGHDDESEVEITDDDNINAENDDGADADNEQAGNEEDDADNSQNNDNGEDDDSDACQLNDSFKLTEVYHNVLKIKNIYSNETLNKQKTGETTDNDELSSKTFSIAPSDNEEQPKQQQQQQLEQLFFRQARRSDPSVAVTALDRISCKIAELDNAMRIQRLKLALDDIDVEFDACVNSMFDDDVSNLSIKFDKLVNEIDQQEIDDASAKFSDICENTENLQIIKKLQTRTQECREERKEEQSPVGTDTASANNSQLGIDEADLVYYSSSELSLLKDIYAKKLDKTDAIYGKVATAIRNKLTPTRLQKLLEQQKQQQAVSFTSCVHSTPTRAKAKCAVGRQRRSRSLSSTNERTATAAKSNKSSMPKSKRATKQTFKAYKADAECLNNSTSDETVGKVQSTNNLIGKSKRNFILENIRKAGQLRKPCQSKTTGSDGNTTSSSNSISRLNIKGKATFKPFAHSPRSSNNSNKDDNNEQQQQSVNTDARSEEVCIFQKSTDSSPVLWVSINRSSSKLSNSDKMPSCQALGNSNSVNGMNIDTKSPSSQTSLASVIRKLSAKPARQNLTSSDE